MKKTLMLVATLAALAATPAVAEILFEATLTGSNEVPPNPSGAYGVASLIVNDAVTEGFYTVNFAGLEGGAQTGAHFHRAPAGANGPVVLPLALGSPLAGFWELTPEDAEALLLGSIYVNIHTQVYPGGEIRGQLIETAVANENSTWSEIKGLYR